MRWWLAGGSIFLFVLNSFICRELFSIEYTRHMGSIEAAYIGLSRYLQTHWSDLDWFPLWYTGVPYQNTYPPLLHIVVAAFSQWTHVSPALAHHAVSAFFYALGPVALFWCALAFQTLEPLGLRSVRFWVAMGAGILYSLWSPSLFLLPDFRAALGWAGAARLDALVTYGEGPHVTSLTLLPLAALALHWATQQRSAPRIYLAAFAMAAVVLTNWLGAFALAVAVVSYLGSRAGEKDWLRLAGVIFGIGILAYAIAAPWAPPSTLRAISHNAQYVVGSYVMTSRHAIAGVMLVAALAAAGWAMHRAKVAMLIRWAVFMTLIFGVMVAGEAHFGFSLMPQATRYHLELEFPVCLALAGIIGSVIPKLDQRALWALPAAAAVFLPIQMYRYRTEATQWIQPIDITTTLEYQAAKTFEEKFPDQRVFAVGSTSFWLNAFTNNSQVRGGFAQGIVNPTIPMVEFGIPFTEHNGEDSAMWLRLYGAHAVLVAGETTRDAFHDWHDPAKFEGVLPEVWRNGDDAIYEIPQRSKSLAHAINPEQVPERTPINLLDSDPIRPLAAALEDANLPSVEFEWTSAHSAHITGNLKPGQLYFTQIAYHPGWHAYRDGLIAPIHEDPLGMMLIEPRCNGECNVTLEFDGGAEMLIAEAASWAAIFGGLIWFLLEWRNRALRGTIG